MKKIPVFIIALVFLSACTAQTKAQPQPVHEKMPSVNNRTFTEWKELAETTNAHYDYIGSHPDSLICIPNKRFDCSEKSCKEANAEVFLIVTSYNPDTGSIYDRDRDVYRCDQMDCDKRKYSKNVSGIYEILSYPPGASMIKINNSDFTYYQIMSFINSTGTYFGKCYLSSQLGLDVVEKK
jgi:hypothetical protein